MMHSKLSLGRDYLYCTKCKEGFFPLDSYLNITNIDYSPDFAFAVGHFTAITTSFQDCWKSFKYAHLSEPSVSYIQKVASDLGQIGIAAEDELLKKGENNARNKGKTIKNDIFAVMLDGGRCLLKEKDKKSPQWREVKVGAFVNYHKGLNKEGEVIPIRDKTDYIGRIKESSEIFGERLWMESLARGYCNSKIKVFIGDGAKYNWEIWKSYFSDSIGILDWYHATEHLAKSAKLIFGDKEEDYKEWYDARKDELYNGECVNITNTIKDNLKLVKNSEAKEKLKTEMEYFQRNKDRINYKEYEEAGLPLGSGVIEGGIKQLVNKRIKGTEKHWVLHNGNNILKIRIDEVGSNLHNLCQLYEKAA